MIEIYAVVDKPAQEAVAGEDLFYVTLGRDVHVACGRTIKAPHGHELSGIHHHHAVAQALHDRATVLPVRFGTRCAHTDTIASRLPPAAELARRLIRLRGLTEVAIRISHGRTCGDVLAPHAASGRDRAPAPGTASCETTSFGRAVRGPRGCEAAVPTMAFQEACDPETVGVDRVMADAGDAAEVRIASSSGAASCEGLTTRSEWARPDASDPDSTKPVAAGGARLRLAAMQRRARARLWHDAASRLVEESSAVRAMASAWMLASLASEDHLGKAVWLVPKERRLHALEKLERIAGRFAPERSATVSGPWPPYHFVNAGR